MCLSANVFQVCHAIRLAMGPSNLMPSASTSTTEILLICMHVLPTEGHATTVMKVHRLLERIPVRLVITGSRLSVDGRVC